MFIELHTFHPRMFYSNFISLFALVLMISLPILSTAQNVTPNTTDNPQYFKLLIVNDFKTFNWFYRDLIELLHWNNKVLNIVALIYSQLNINIVITGIETWTEKDYFVPGPTIENEIESFAALVEEKYRPKYRNTFDAAMLITGHDFPGESAGIAYRSSVCAYHSTGLVQLTSGGDEIYPSVELPLILFSSVFAHEIGHILGLDHILQNDTLCYPCSSTDHDCVMSPQIGWNLLWSNCSREIITKRIEEELDDCLVVKPTSIGSSFTAICGNDVLEYGEDCDCGTFNFVCSNCCDSRCKFKVPSTALSCSTGKCCDETTCQLKQVNTQCNYTAIGDSCNLQATCDGVSPICPGTENQKSEPCTKNKQPGLCYNGRCNTNICNGNGRCTVTSNGSLACQCEANTAGPFSLIKCPQDCHNLGICQKNGTCNCFEGFVGTNCKINPDFVHITRSEGSTGIIGVTLAVITVIFLMISIITAVYRCYRKQVPRVVTRSDTTTKTPKIGSVEIEIQPAEAAPINTAVGTPRSTLSMDSVYLSDQPVASSLGFVLQSNDPVIQTDILAQQSLKTESYA